MVLVNLFASVGMARSNMPPLGKLYFLISYRHQLDDCTVEQTIEQNAPLAENRFAVSYISQINLEVPLGKCNEIKRRYVTEYRIANNEVRHL